MSSVPAEYLAERYGLELDESWRSWFNDEQAQRQLLGNFQDIIDFGSLLEPAPLDLWPGFMLPDSLPVVGNGYGDWWCIRISEQNTIAEIVQWFHSGGDWIPVGRDIPSAALWDVISGWRGSAIGNRQAAHEFPAPQTAKLSADDADTDDFTHSVARQLNLPHQAIARAVADARTGRYHPALVQLLELGLSQPAAVCELIELALQSPLVELAKPQIANQFGMNWIPDFTRWLFDTAEISNEAREAILAQRSDVRFDQDWARAEQLAHHALALRSDLSWASNIAGWAAERRGDVAAAVAIYFAHRHASAFTDQSVRLRSHWFPERFGKFAAAQLYRLQSHLTTEQLSDPYLNIFWQESPQRLRSAIRDYWLKQARGCVERGEHATAYNAFMQAGWDLGAERLSDYRVVLDGLVESATRAGWTARAKVADAHRASLTQRLPK